MFDAMGFIILMSNKLSPRIWNKLLPIVTISHKRIPNDQTSLWVVNTRSRNDSIAIHFKGSLPLVSFLYWLSLKISRDKPKSHTLMTLLYPNKTFLAARSRWTYLLAERYSCNENNRYNSQVDIEFSVFIYPTRKQNVFFYLSLRKDVITILNPLSKESFC